MNRRQLIALVGGAAAWPAVARAQQPALVRRIGVLMGIANDLEGQERIKAFQQGLQELGWTVGRNIRIDYRWAGGAVDMQPYARDLVAAAPDALLTTSTTTATALRQETGTIPIVFIQVSDPLGSGLVASLARPGANLTGFTNFEFSMAGKWVEILKEIDPRIVSIDVMFNPETAPYAEGYVRLVEAAGRALAIDVSISTVRDVSGLSAAIVAIARRSNAALIVMPDIFTVTHRERIAALANEHHLPAVYPYKNFVSAGGLISYGTDQLELFRQAASYVDRILKGENPANLPVQQPTKFELVINLKTAKVLGLTIPSSLLARADEVIE